MINELKIVALTEDIPEHGLQKGDLGTVVLVHADGEAYEVEFLTLEGRTVAIATISQEKLRAVGSREIAQSRQLAV